MVGGNGNKITKIDILQGPTPNEQLLATITSLNQDPVDGCIPPGGSLEVTLPGGGVDYIFLTRYYYEDMTDEAGDTYTVTTSPTEECKVITLTL